MNSLDHLWQAQGRRVYLTRGEAETRVIEGLIELLSRVPEAEVDAAIDAAAYGYLEAHEAAAGGGTL